MFTANLSDYQMRHEELIQQAEDYRLTKTSKRDWFSQIRNALGKIMINSGRQLLTLAEAVR
jgi:hypothetical protein